MTPTTKDRRRKSWRLYGFAGTIDWAVDLQSFSTSDDSMTADGEFEWEFLPGGAPSADSLGSGTFNSASCDWTKSYSSLTDLQKDAGSLPHVCVQYYSLGALQKMGKDSKSRYNDVNNGYDDKFKAYIRYIRDLVPASIDVLMQYDDATKKFYEGMACMYRRVPLLPLYSKTNHLVLDFNCDYKAFGSDKKSLACSKLSYEDLTQGTFELWLTPSDLDGFHADLLKKTGVAPDWVDLNGEYKENEGCSSEGTALCPPTTGNRKWHNYPELSSSLVVPNPKDTASDSYNSYDDLSGTITDKMKAIASGKFTDDIDDIIQTVSLPIFLLAQGVESMDQVKKLGEEEEKKEKQKKKDFILQMVGIALIFIPFVGDAATAISGAATLARVAAIAGDAATVGFSIYDIVKNPDSAFMDLLGIMFGLRGLAKQARDANGFATMGAAARKLRSDGTIGKIGGSIKKFDDALQDMVAVCKRT
jgi:hypothetical protein